MKRLLLIILLITGLITACTTLYAEDDMDQADYTADQAPEISDTESADFEEMPDYNDEPSGEEMEAMSSIEAMDGDAGPEIGLGGGMAAFLKESFQTDLATGAATMSIPITAPPGRKNMQPRVVLSYSSNNSNGICGVGWSLTQNSIQRSTKRGVPKYDGTDTFTFASGGSSAELVNIGGNEYRAEIESGFMRYVFENNLWTVYDKSGTKYTFGPLSGSRLENGSKIFSWCLAKVEDVYGNYITYTYTKPSDGQIYLNRIEYTGSNSLAPDKAVEFYYEAREDKLPSYRSGWFITTSSRLSAIKVLLDNAEVWQYKLDYITSSDTARSLLDKVTVEDARGNSLPAKEFVYQGLD